MTRRRVLATVTILLAGSTASALGTSATGAGSPPTFGTPVVADAWVPGFEPDVAVDRSAQGRGTLYSSWPNGFSTTISYVTRSNDLGRSFHLVEGNIIGKPTNCIGGGDSEIQVSPVDGKFYFADLQGFTNFSNSV